jgi:hydrogenase maturation protease
MGTVIIGVGNPVRSDDGAGLAVARRLREHLAGTEGVTVEELWAGGLRLAEAMAGYDRAIVVDAMEQGDQPPGSIRRLSLEELGATRTTTCTHDASLPAALEMRRQLGAPVPDEIEVWGIEAQDLVTFSEELTEPVARAVPRVVEAILDGLKLGKGA